MTTMSVADDEEGGERSLRTNSATALLFFFFRGSKGPPSVGASPVFPTSA